MKSYLSCVQSFSKCSRNGQNRKSTSKLMKVQCFDLNTLYKSYIPKHQLRNFLKVSTFLANRKPLEEQILMR